MDCKTCTKCKTEKPLTEFRKRKASKDGLAYKCKSCAVAVDKKFYENNTEQVKASNKNWSQNNKDAHNKIKAKWADKNPDSVNISRKNWRDANPEAISQKSRKRSQKLTIVTPEGQTAALNRIRLNRPEGYDVDHIWPLSKGGLNSVDNICYLPIGINRGDKNDKLPEGKVLHDLLLKYAIIPAIGGTTEDNRLKYP